MSIVNDIKGLSNIPWGLELPCGLCAEFLEFFCAISPIYVQIPVIIEDFFINVNVVSRKVKNFTRGEGVQGGIGGHEGAATGAWKATYLYIYKVSLYIY